MTSKKLTPIKSIKKYCQKECCAGSLIDWKECPNTKCVLYSYRLGKRPPKQPFTTYMSPTSTSKGNEKKQVVLPNKFENSEVLEAKQ